MPNATATFNDFLIPAIGICNWQSQISRTSGSMPITSFPTTSTVSGSFFSSLTWFIGIEKSVFSNAQIRFPDFFKFPYQIPMCWGVFHNLYAFLPQVLFYVPCGVWVVVLFRKGEFWIYQLHPKFEK